jgi:hypothetical protein
MNVLHIIPVLKKPGFLFVFVNISLIVSMGTLKVDVCSIYTLIKIIVPFCTFAVTVFSLRIYFLSWFLLHTVCSLYYVISVWLQSESSIYYSRVGNVAISVILLLISSNHMCGSFVTFWYVMCSSFDSTHVLLFGLWPSSAFLERHGTNVQSYILLVIAVYLPWWFELEREN